MGKAVMSDVERIYWKALGEVFGEMRQESDFTQDEIALCTKLSRPSIANIEAGRQKLNFYQASLFCDTMNCDIRRFEQQVDHRFKYLTEDKT